MSCLAVTSMWALNISFCGALALGVSDEKSDDILIHLLLGIIICLVQGLNYSPLIILWYYVESKIKNFFFDHYYLRFQIIICLGVRIFLMIWKILKLSMPLSYYLNSCFYTIISSLHLLIVFIFL